MQTLQYVDSERKAVDSNRVWKNQAALKNRRKLLDKVHGWYDKEAKKIDSVLAGMSGPAQLPMKKRKHERLPP